MESIGWSSGEDVGISCSGSILMQINFKKFLTGKGYG